MGIRRGGTSRAAGTWGLVKLETMQWTVRKGITNCEGQRGRAMNGTRSSERQRAGGGHTEVGAPPRTLKSALPAASLH